MSGARAAWKQVLAVYTVRTVTDPDNPTEMAAMVDEKAAILRTVFWDISTIAHTLDTEDVEEDILDDDGLPTGDTTTVTYTVLRIIVSHKTTDEMAAQYGFSDEQIDNKQISKGFGREAENCFSRSSRSISAWYAEPERIA